MIQTLRRIPLWAAAALLVYMPFHIFLSQSLSLATGGLEVWKIGKDILLAIAVLFTICLVWQQKAGNRLFNILVGLSFGYLVLHLLAWALNPDIHQRSAILGTIYNMRLLGFLVLGYGAMLVYPAKFVFRSVIQLLLVISTIVALLGVVQCFLPKDVLSHLGYSLERGVRPAFFIDDNPAFPRIMSTLREPNALGAYLIVPLAALAALILRARNLRGRLLYVGLWLIHGVALLFTSSRSAWLGAFLATLLVIWWLGGAKIVRWVKQWWPLLMIAAACLLLISIVARDSQFVKSHITHSTPEVVQDLDSNDYHWLFIRLGIEGAVQEPLGHGPGTAGIVSIQNPNEVFLTENYYIQIAYEAGLLGLAVFVAISAIVYRELYRRHDYLGVVLLSAFWAYVLTNTLLHTWSNEAVAAQWWLLAGIAIGPGMLKSPSKV